MGLVGVKGQRVAGPERDARAGELDFSGALGHDQVLQGAGSMRLGDFNHGGGQCQLVKFGTP